MSLRLVCVDELLLNGPGYLVAGESYRVGRSSRCAFVVSDLSVSRYHAEVTFGEDQVRIKDLKSRNGTYVDGVRIEEIEVQPGQSLRFGTVKFEVKSAKELSESDEISEMSTHLVKYKPSIQLRLNQLSDGQRRVLDVLLTGLSEKEVGSRLDISTHTVHNHVKAIYLKMDVTSRSELLALFVDPEKPGQ